MKTLATSILRRVRDVVAKSGLEIRTVRGRDHWRAGMELIWRPFDSRTERVALSHVHEFGEEAIFLVRNQKDYIQSHLLAGKYYASDELKIIQRFYNSGTFLDIGANIGNHSIFAAKVLKAPKVIAVEPFPSAYRILRCNIALNDLFSTIIHVPVALSSSDCLGSMTSLEGNLGLTVLSEGVGDIPVRKGDDIFADEDIGFVKIDVEGAEMKVLEGMISTLERCRPPIMIEVDDINAQAFNAFCKEFDYRIADLKSPYRSNTYYMIVPVSDSTS